MDYKDKIRKLLALAKSPEPEEAKLALLKARKLMAEHKLTERDLEEHDTTVIQQEIDETFSKKANSWMEYIYTYLGNGIRHELCMKFVQSGYDLGVIDEGTQAKGGQA